MQRFILAFTTLFTLTTSAQTTPVQVLADKLEAQYVFPEKGAAMARRLREADKRGAYAGLQAEALATKLTSELQSWSADRHLHVTYSADSLPNVPEPVMNIPAAEKPAYFEYLRHDNYGITRLEVLRGSVGYLAFNYLCTPETAGESYAAAMAYLSRTDALIIDLRNCRGSTSPEAVPFLLSYLFDQPTHLNDLRWRKGNRTRQLWTAQLPGRGYGNKPVYVLTSSVTFSGAEEMAYDLQQLKRATLIGEATGGGANPGGDVSLTPHFQVFLPVGQAINPISGTNWEGVGVQPDSVVSPRKALHVAHLLALNSLRKMVTDGGYGAFLDQTIQGVQDAMPQLVPATFELQGYSTAKEVFVAGSFNDWSPRSARLQRVGNKWMVTTEVEPGEIEYKFIVDGVWMSDPANKERAKGDLSNSVRRVGKIQ